MQLAGAGLGHNRRERGLADLKRIAPEVVAVQLDEVERVEEYALHRCSGLLPPGVVQSAGIDGIETEFIDKLQDDGLGLRIVARNGAATSPSSVMNSRSSHHSITSSARASSVDGTSRLKALAVLRLMTSWNFVDCITGRSADFWPLRDRPA